MNNYSNILFPEIINEAFPVLDGVSYVRQLASLVPLCPDTAFHLFADENGCFFTLVMTDYPDPTSQSTELKQISGEYEFEFTHLIKPYANDKHIAICENDEMNEQFSVPGPNSYYHYYLAVVNMNITHHLVTAIRTNDLSAYQRIRYPAIPDGELVRFVGEDFSNVDFDQFVMGFFAFENCNLDGAKHIYGQPIYFKDSSVRNVDFRSVKVIIEAENCDFRGMKYDDETKFVYGSGKLAVQSRFVDCKFDDEAREFLGRQGVLSMHSEQSKMK